MGLLNQKMESVLNFNLLNLLMLITVVCASKKPNIILIVADDLGWNDVGWHNPALLTPNLNELAKGGITFNHSYVQPVCSPSRTAFMTGMFPFRAGMQHWVIHPLQPKGVPTNFTFLPQKLKEIGYSTHIVGKWHLGFCNLSYTPLHRGFDSHYGYYNGAEGYFDHSRPYGSVDGYDFRDNTRPAKEANGTYSTYLFAEKAAEIIRISDEDKPFFLYLPFQAVHNPLQVPERFINLYQNIRDKNRRIYSGMVSALDEAIGNITSVLKEAGVMKDTIIAFTTDNGGVAIGGGNNWPLRGQKNTLWEGGTRGPAFVTGGPFTAAEGKIYNGLFHAVDWFPTLLEAAGYTDGLPRLDGVSQLSNLVSNASEARTEFIYNVDNILKNGAIRIGNWKLIIGVAGPANRDGWKPAPTESSHTLGFFRRILRFLNKWREIFVSLINPKNLDWDKNDGGMFEDVDDFTANAAKRQLFNLEIDPTEHHDVSKNYPGLVKEMYQRFNELTAGYKAWYPPDSAAGNPANFNGVWSPGWCKARA